ncbi:MAG TPA: hypothetical protein VFZ48_05140 [Candidatus Saccharimonadales bacterium]
MKERCIMGAGLRLTPERTAKLVGLLEFWLAVQVELEFGKPCAPTKGALYFEFKADSAEKRAVGVSELLEFMVGREFQDLAEEELTGALSELLGKSESTSGIHLHLDSERDHLLLCL